jgi:hypothetical protein
VKYAPSFPSKPERKKLSGDVHTVFVHVLLHL